MAGAGRFGKLVTSNSCLLLCDMQTQFKKSIKFFDEIVHNSNRLLQAAQILNVPVIATEQYPQGLGKTVPELGLEQYGIKAIEKTKFSMCLEPVLTTLKKSPQIDSIILCGIEAHVCIQQTAIDFRAQGYEVFVPLDACSSRGILERLMAYSYMKQAGCWLTTTESAILSLTGDASHPRFKELQAIIKKPDLIPEFPCHSASSITRV